MNFKESVVTRLRKVSRSPGVIKTALRFVWHGTHFYFDGTQTKNGLDLSFYPGKPSFIYALCGMCKVLGMRAVYGYHAQTVVFFADTTHYTKPLPSGFESWVNGNCRDIRKSTVAHIQEEIFGTKLTIDPKTHSGVAVEKSEVNGSHDGKVVTCPITPKDGFVYQQLIDNEIEEGVVEDLRVVLVGGTIPLVYKKRRKTEKRFLNTNHEITVCSPEEVFNNKEIQTIKQYGRQIGLDIGELDILRDKKTAMLYVVDVTTTSMSPPIGLSYKVRRECLTKIAEVFKNKFLYY